MTTMDRMYKMLILEDDEGSLHYLRMLFQNDFKIVAALDYDNALGELNDPANKDIDAIIADKKLPYLSGIHFLKESKNKFPDVIRVLVTAHHNENDIEISINDIGVDLMYFKPLTDKKTEDLKDRLKKLLMQKNRVKNAVEP